VYVPRARVADRSSSAPSRAHCVRATLPMTGLPARLTAAARAAVGSERKETQVDEHNLAAMRAALVAELEQLIKEQARPGAICVELARMDAAAEAEYQRKAKDVGEARRDKLAPDERKDLVEMWALYLALATNKTRHPARWRKARG
jgi:hypothetical protein